MVLPIAPLDYERYAALIALPPPAEAVQPRAAVPARAVEPVGAPSPTSPRHAAANPARTDIADVRLGAVAAPRASHGVAPPATSPDRTSAGRLPGPPPMVLSLMTGPPDVTPKQASALYERAVGAPPKSVDIRA